MNDRPAEIFATVEVLDEFIVNALTSAGSDEGQSRSVARALSSASLRGVDSHGVRLLPHYVRVLQGGRVAGKPQLQVTRTAPGAAIVDADNGFGHHASYRAIQEGIALARGTGIAMVAVVNSSHFGAAGCYALEAAEAGLAAFVFCNSDSFVLPHDGIRPFHGTNPIAFAAPVAGELPYLVDMATSIVPWNRIQDYRAKGMDVPADVAVDTIGRMTTDPGEVAALLPLGGETYGYKGASLASMVEILSAVMTGMAHCSRLIPMVGTDMSTPRQLGHLFVVMNPEAFVSRASYEDGMAAYLADIRGSSAKDGRTVLAPGDREWACARERRRDGVPMAPALVAEYLQIAQELGIDSLELTGRKAG